MSKIKIPILAKTFASRETDTFHVSFPFEEEKAFNDWCEKEKIGDEPGCRKDVVKSYCHVFVPLAKRSIFVI